MPFKYPHPVPMNGAPQPFECKPKTRSTSPSPPKNSLSTFFENEPSNSDWTSMPVCEAIEEDGDTFAYLGCDQSVSTRSESLDMLRKSNAPKNQRKSRFLEMLAPSDDDDDDDEETTKGSLARSLSGSTTSSMSPSIRRSMRKAPFMNTLSSEGFKDAIGMPTCHQTSKHSVSPRHSRRKTASRPSMEYPLSPKKSSMTPPLSPRRKKMNTPGLEGFVGGSPSRSPKKSSTMAPPLSSPRRKQIPPSLDGFIGGTNTLIASPSRNNKRKVGRPRLSVNENPSLDKAPSQPPMAKPMRKPSPSIAQHQRKRSGELSTSKGKNAGSRVDEATPSTSKSNSRIPIRQVSGTLIYQAAA